MDLAGLHSILYVDDEPDIRQIVQLVLSLTVGLKVHTGESGERALELMRELRPDLLILDVMMPGLDGPGTLKRMRADPTIAHTPVIFITAKAMAREVELYRNMGAVGVIAKPFDPMQLSQQVFSLWKDHAAEALTHAAPDNIDPLQPLITELGEKFLQRTRTETVVLRGLLERAHLGDSTVIGQLEHLAHKIHGTGATFGFAAVSDCAREIEHLIVGLKASGAPVDADRQSQRLQRLTECTEQLAQEVETAAAR